MAATWIARAAGVTQAQGKSVIDLMNATGSARLLKAYLLSMNTSTLASINNEIPGFGQYFIRRLTASTGGTAVTPLAFDTNSTALAAQITSGTGRMVKATGQFRSFIYCQDVIGAFIFSAHSELQILVPLSEWGRYGVATSAAQPIHCTAGYGCDIAQASSRISSYTGDAEILFTDE